MDNKVQVGITWFQGQRGPAGPQGATGACPQGPAGPKVRMENL